MAPEIVLLLMQTQPLLGVELKVRLQHPLLELLELETGTYVLAPQVRTRAKERGFQLLNALF